MKTFREFKTGLDVGQISEDTNIPVSHATDAVGKVLGQKGAVNFLAKLKPGNRTHTSWNEINSALVDQGTQSAHIAKVAGHLKPNQYNESTNRAKVKIKKAEYDELYMKHKDNYVAYRKNAKYIHGNLNPSFHVEKNSDGSISTQTWTGKNIGTPKHDVPTIIATSKPGSNRSVYHKIVHNN